MVGTLEGGRKTAVTIKKRYGENYYAHIGRKGGMNGRSGGFAANPDLAKLAGKKGGSASKRGKATKVKKYEQTMITMFAKGYSLVDISRETGLPYYSVTYFFRKLRKP